MVEHVGAERIDLYARRLARLLPAGRPAAQPRHRPAAPQRPRGRAVLGALRLPRRRPRCTSRGSCSRSSAPGSCTEHVEGFADDYAETLRHWARRLDDNLDEAVRLAGDGALRVWRLYLRAARNGFETGFTSIYQVLASKA